MTASRHFIVAALWPIAVAMPALAQQPIGVINPIFPEPDAQNIDLRTAFQLPSVSKDTVCEIRVGQDKELKEPLTARALEPGVSAANIGADLKVKTQYYWQALCRERAGAQPLVAQSRILAFSTAAAVPPPPTFATRTPQANKRVGVTEPSLFSWERVPGATGYELVLRAGENKPKRVKDDEKETKIVLDHPNWVNPVHPTTGAPLTPYKAVQLESDKQYYWQVNAVQDKQVIAQTEEQRVETRPEWSKAAKDAGFRLQRAFTLLGADEKNEAAAFGVQGSEGERPQYSALFALGWSPGVKHIGTVTLTPDASIEAKLHSHGDSKKTDAMKVRIGAKFDQHHADGFSSYTSTALKYETSRKADTKKVLAELLYTPTINALRIGQRMPDPQHPLLADPPSVTFIWRPYFGVDVGRTVETGDTNEKDRTLLRGLFRTSAQIGVPGLAQQLNIPAVTLFADNYYRYLPREETHRGNNYLETGIDFEIRDGLSIAVRYNVGRDAPTFAFERNFSVNLGVQF